MTQTKKAGVARLWDLARPHWKALGFATVLLLVETIALLSYPQVAREGIDQLVQPAGSDATWTMLGYALLVLFTVHSVLVGVRFYFFTSVGEKIVVELRMKLFDAILAQSISFFDETHTGELTSRLTSDTHFVQSVATTNLSAGLQAGIQVVGSLAFLFSTSPKLSLIALGGLPMAGLVGGVYGKFMRRLTNLVQKLLAESTSIAEEFISGIRTVRIFAAESTVRKRYQVALDGLFSSALRRALLGALYGGGITAVGYAISLAVLWVGATMVAEGNLTPGDLTAFLLYTVFAGLGFRQLGSVWAELMKASGASQRVFNLIDEVPAGDFEQARQFHELGGEIEFRNVSFAYPSRPELTVLDSISFRASPGEKVAIVGPSGAGKTTVGALTLRFYELNEGAILLDGTDLRNFDVNHLRRQIGVVSQDPMLFSGTIRDNVAFASPAASLEDVEAALRAANASGFVKSFTDGIDTVIGERGVRLSGGQKQRIAIARAILTDPPVLILDEATSALDVESEALVQQALDTLMKGRTSLVIAHRLSTVAGADLVLVLDEGRLVESGTHSELVDKKGMYFRLIESQRLLR